MSQQIQISGGAKVRNLQDVIIGTSGVLSSLAFDVANGVPRLDVNGKILVSQLPNSVMEYKGTWNAATNTPTLANGTGNQGDVYLCNVAGTVDFGAGAIAFFVGDQVIYSGSIWQRASGATGTVTSVALTESGDSLNITGSPITTSGTINIGFNGTNLQYVNGAGNLTTFPILTGFVPYTGATANVDLGVFDLTADLITGATGSFASNGGSDTFAINHSSGSGIALNITKGGNGEGLYINKTSGSGNAVTIIGTLEATTLVKNGGTSSQFLKADGSVDSNTYALDNAVVHLAGTETITGAKTFSGYTTFTSTVDITSGLTFSNSGFTLLLQPPTLSVNRTVTLPNGTGTIALTSDLTDYVTLSTAQTISGTKTFTSFTKNDFGVLLNASGNYTAASGYNGFGGISNGIRVVIGQTAIHDLVFSASTNYTYTFPSATGTIALVGGSGVGTVTSVAALTIGTSGTDLSSSVANSTTTPVITLNVPTASATNRGALSSADWTTFNNKQNALTNPVTGTGTTNYLPKFTGASTIGNSNLINDASGNLGLGVTPIYRLDVQNTSGFDSRFKTTSLGGTVGILLEANNDFSGTSQAYIKAILGGGNGQSTLTFGTATNVGDTTASEKMRLFPSGNLLVQTGGTFTDSGYKLDVNGTGRFSGALTGTSATFSSATIGSLGSGSNAILDFATNASGSPRSIIYRAATAFIDITNTAGTAVFQLSNGGAATFSSSVTATSFFESSDSRLKTLIQDNYQTKGIASITPKLYTKNGKVELGYYAQDFVGILDSAVVKGSDDMLSLSYREVLVAKVYALEQRIKELETK